MAFNLDALLLALHIIAAACWFGAGWYDRLMVAPAIKAAGTAGVEMIKQHINRGGGARWFAPASIATVLTGIVLYWRLGVGFGSVSGIMLSVGGLLGILSLLTGIIFHGPLEKSLREAVDANDHAQIIQRAGHLERHTTISAGLVTAALLLMTLRHVVT